MFVSGVVASVTLGGVLVALLAVAAVLAYIDKRCGKGRQH